MNTFLEDIISEISNLNPDELRQTCLIFPTRRACLIFRKKLAESISKPVWSPGIQSIGDFVNRHSAIQVAEEIPLLLLLFDVYKKHWPEQEFSRFYAWGKMLISDFDEVDKQLSDPSRLFTTIGELRKIEASFLQEPENMGWIREFIDSLSPERMSKLQEEFNKRWDELRLIYGEYNRILEQTGTGYEGKVYRNLVAELKQGKFQSHWKKFIFAGFYGFSRVEEQMISLLGEKYDVAVKWDFDQYYVSNPAHEAGYYFRKSPLFSPDKEKGGRHFDSGKRHLETTGVSLAAGQARYAGQILQKLLTQQNGDLSNTAIILPDEKMLFPVLHSIPADIKLINVTMGYPVRNSHFADLFELLYQMYRWRDTGKSGQRVFHRIHATNLIDHPLIRGSFEMQGITDEMMRKPMLSAEEIANYFRFERAGVCFADPASAEEVFAFTENLMSSISDGLSAKGSHGARFESMVLNHIASEIGILKEQITGHEQHITAETLWQMIRECVAGLKIPFSGEPVSGLQIMGFLESRALDFENVILLNLNEGILPSTTTSGSFIPYSLRKGFGLSTYEDQDASWSYHFYRLFHRASSIYLVYNTEVSKLGGGEPSRFLLQLRHELKKYMGERLTISEQTLNIPMAPDHTKKVEIVKDAGVMKTLNLFRPDDESASKKRFSSSALTTYISCKLQFYFSYVAGLREKDVPGKKIEPVDFGRILHKATENIYKNTEGEVTSKMIEALLPEVDSHVDEAIRAEYGIDPANLEGTDIIQAEVLRELVRRILVNDMKDAPFRLISLEGEYRHHLKINENLTVNLYGKFDRVDEHNGITRIIDYKTGSIKLDPKEFESVFQNPDFKSLFQLYFYTLLYGEHTGQHDIRSGIYLAREIGGGIRFPKDENAFSAEGMNRFSERLKLLIEEIFDPGVSFSQTDDEKRCLYCPYQMICRRN